MRKIFYWCTAAAFVAAIGTVMAQDGERYVRKNPEHNFFMPKFALGRPEQLPMPRYVKGEEESVKNLKEAEEIPHWTDDEIEAMRQLDKTPAYQRKYDEYTKDIDKIDREGNLPKNQALEDDLQKMDSNEKIRVEITSGESGKPLF